MLEFIKKNIFTKNAVPFWLVFLVYIPVLFLFRHYAPPNPTGYSFPVLIADSTEYVKLADNLLDYKTFSYSNQKPIAYEYFRTPGYPFFLALIFLFTKSFYFVSFVQIIIAALTAFLIFKIGEKTISANAGLIAAALFAVNGSTLFYTLTLMSDTLFVFLIVFAVFLMFFVKGKKEIYLLFAAGLLLGFATLVRAISIFLPFVFVVYYFFINRKIIAFKRIALLLSVFALGFAMTLAPWIIRNRAHSGVWGISSLGGYNLFSFNVPYFLMNKNNISFKEARAIMYKETNISDVVDAMQLRNSKELSRAAMKFIKDDPIGYAKFHLSRLPEYFGGNSSKNFYVNTIEIIQHKSNPFPQKTQLLDDILSKKDIKFLWARMASQSFFPLEYLLWFTALLLFFVSLFFKKYRIQSLFFVVLAMYFAVLTGPVAHVRYRMPAEPFMFLSALMGFYGLREYLMNLRNRKNKTTL